MNLLDDSLSADLARDGKLTDAMTERFLEHRTLCDVDRRGRDPVHLLGLRPLHRGGGARTRADAGAQAERGDDRAGGRSRAARSACSRPSRRRWRRCRANFPLPSNVVPKLAEGAMAALDRGDRAEHDRLVTEASKDLRGCDVDRAGAIQHGAGGRIGGGGHGPAGADHARQRGVETEDRLEGLKSEKRRPE